MSADPSSERESSGLRPLPSVNMALLPDELRARRTRRLVLSAVVGAVVLGAPLLWIARSVIPQTWAWMEDTLGHQDAKLAADLGMPEGLALEEVDGGVEEELTEEQTLALSRSRPNARYETLFGGVPSFRGALLNAGLEEDECAAVEQALQRDRGLQSGCRRAEAVVRAVAEAEDPVERPGDVVRLLRRD